MAKRIYVSVKSETVYDDGDYSALVSVYGREYAISFIAGEIKVTGFASQYESTRGWKARARRQAAIDFAEARIAQQGPAFITAHRELYELEAA